MFAPALTTDAPPVIESVSLRHEGAGSPSRGKRHRALSADRVRACTENDHRDRLLPSLRDVVVAAKRPVASILHEIVGDDSGQ